jgi:NitT/TauT family transport system permease protein
VSQKNRVALYRLATLIVLLSVWEGAVKLGLVNSFWISSPTMIAHRALELVRDGALFYHTGITLLEAFAGLVAGTIVGILLGLVLGANRTLGQVVEPFIMALNALPRVALAPLLVMYVGIGFASKFLLAFSLVVVIVMVNTFEGVRAVDPMLVNAMRVLGAKQLQLFRMVLIPNSVPWILAGIRVSVAFAIVGAIVGEFISAQAGIGYMIDQASGAYDTTGIMVPLLTLMLCAVVLDFIITRLTRYLLRWRVSRMQTT